MAYQEVRCLDLADGSLIWKGGRFGPDGSCLVTADGYVVAWGNGTLAVIDSAARSPAAYREVTRRTDLCERNAAWPHVVLAGSRIYCKDKQGVITCFDCTYSRVK